MKTYLTYGFLLTLACFLVTLVFFLTRLDTDPTQKNHAKALEGLAKLAIAIVFLVAGMRARRAAQPGAFGYGKAVTAGINIQVCASLLNVVTTWIFFTWINPGAIDRIVQRQLNRLQDRGFDGDKLDQAEKITRIFANPPVLAIFSALGALIMGAIIVLIAAAFIRREELPELPAERRLSP